MHESKWNNCSFKLLHSESQNELYRIHSTSFICFNCSGCIFQMTQRVPFIWNYECFYCVTQRNYDTKFHWNFIVSTFLISWEWKREILWKTFAMTQRTERKQKLNEEEDKLLPIYTRITIFSHSNTLIINPTSPNNGQSFNGMMSKNVFQLLFGRQHWINAVLIYLTQQLI